VIANAKIPLSAPQQQRAPPTCYKCGVEGHLLNQCKSDADDKKNSSGDGKVPFKCYKCSGFGHIARNCADNKNKNNEKNYEKLPAEKVRGEKGNDERSMKAHLVYINAQIGRQYAL